MKNGNVRRWRTRPRICKMNAKRNSIGSFRCYKRPRRLSPRSQKTISRCLEVTKIPRWHAKQSWRACVTSSDRKVTSSGNPCSRVVHKNTVSGTVDGPPVLLYQDFWEHALKNLMNEKLIKVVQSFKENKISEIKPESMTKLRALVDTE